MINIDTKVKGVFSILKLLEPFYWENCFYQGIYVYQQNKLTNSRRVVIINPYGYSPLNTSWLNYKNI